MSSDRDDEAAPPLLGSWRNVYALVVAVLFALILMFYALTRWAA